MRGSLPESPSNIFPALGESASVPVTPHRQEEKSQQPRLAAWPLVWAELRAQESVLGTADMFERIGRSQTRMSVSAAGKPRRVGPLHPEGAGHWVGCESHSLLSFPISQPRSEAPLEHRVGLRVSRRTLAFRAGEERFGREL